MSRIHPTPSAHLPTTKVDRPIAHGGFLDTLPVEILGKIFEDCLPSKIKQLPTPSMQEAPLLLCRICLRWRRVAMSMPLLWSSFSAQPSRARDAPPYIPLMKFFLGLSRPYPLSFDIYAANPEQHDLVKQAFPLFLSEVHRWHNVTLDFNDTLCRQFLAAPLGCNSGLESLYFDTFDCTSEQALWIPATLKRFPHLRRLEIGRSSAVPLLELPWPQLTTIQINTPLPLDEVIDILKECSSVENCGFFRVTPSRRPVKPFIIALPTLTRLEVCSGCDIAIILAYLTCPGLTSLSINHLIWDPTRDLEAFGGFLARSSCKLESFRLVDETVTESDIIQYISAPGLQSLKSLDIHGLGASVKTLTMFKYERDTAAFMPLLETLRLDVEGIPDDLFCDMVASRFNSVAITGTTSVTPASLKNVSVRFRQRNFERTSKNVEALHSEHVSDEKRFEDFKRQGLRVAMRLGDWA